MVRSTFKKMATREERLKILRLIESGKISAEEGIRLIEALEQAKDGGNRASTRGAAGSARYIRIRVTDGITGHQKVALNIPTGLVHFGLRFVPDEAGLHVDAIRDAIDSEMVGRIVDVLDDDGGQRVEIFIE